MVALIGAVGPRGTSDRILAMIEQVLDLAELSLSGLDAVAVCAGPGSLTGMRVGIGAAKGLAAGAGLPLLGVSSLQALAAAAAAGPPVLALVDAGRGEVYGAIYRPGDPPILEGIESVGRPEDFARAVEGRSVRLVGGGARRYASAFGSLAGAAGPAEVFLAPGVGRVAGALWGAAENLGKAAGRDLPRALDPTPRYVRRSGAPGPLEG